MRINAVITAYILAAAVSGAALPAAEDSSIEVAAPTDNAPPGYFVPEDFPKDLDPEDFEFNYEEFEKRSANAEPGWTWRPWRPVGLPVGKRDADADAGWTWRPWRPVGLPVGKRDATPKAYADAEAHPGWTWRPVGLPVGKRDADADAGWTWRPWRPVGLPVGKRDADFRA